MAAALPAKHDLVEMAPQVLSAQSVIDAEAPALAVGDDATGPFQGLTRNGVSGRALGTMRAVILPITLAS